MITMAFIITIVIVHNYDNYWEWKLWWWITFKIV